MKRFALKKNKHLIELKSNQGLHYFTSSLAITDDSSKLQLISLIDKYIEEFKEENKYKLSLLKTDHKIKALKKLKRLLRLNCGDTLVHGREVPSPDNRLKERFIINSRLMRKKIPIINKFASNTFYNESDRDSSKWYYNVKDDFSFSMNYLF